MSNSFTLTSPVFSNNSDIPPRYTCDGENISPPLNISGIPNGTQSLALIVSDPDSPSGNFIHWVIYNIPPSVTELSENQIPSGSNQLKNSFGEDGYGGPCPHQGKHHYIFTLFALTIPLSPDIVDYDELAAKIESSKAAQTVLTGLYQRKNPLT